MNYQNTLLKTYRKEIWSKFMRGIRDYDLIQEGDTIAVCISGGKDSMLLALCFKVLQTFSEVSFNVKYLVMDPGYNSKNRQKIIDNAEVLGIDITIFDSTIFGAIEEQSKNPCYLCARMRRGHLYQFARELGCNKIALGHHYDDVIETIVMNMFYGGQIGTMPPRLTSTSNPDMELIRPLTLVREKDIIRWMNHVDLSFLKCACPLSEGLSDDELAMKSKRQEIKKLIETLAKDNPFLEANIYRSVEDVNLSKIMSYYDDETKVSFLDRFKGGNREKF